MSEDYFDIPDPINEAAAQYFNIPYVFPYQRLVISNIIEGKNQIVILPTGGGKSLCFQLPARMTGDLTLVVFPLLSLMSDQKRRLDSAGVPSVLLQGGQTPEEREDIWKKCGSREVSIIISNPETLLTESVFSRLKELEIAHLVVDETHTVSEWGESFRPAYLKLNDIVNQGEINQITAFTATASPEVIAKVKEIVFPEKEVLLVMDVPDRPNISYSVSPVLSKNNTLTKLAESVEKPAIIFCSSRRAVEDTARMLRHRLDLEDIFFYHAGLTKEEKGDVEKWFFSSKKGILVATCAYGMGVDKPDIRTVIHRDVPPSVEAYLQESGRAGRDGNPSKAVLLCSAEDERRALHITREVDQIRYQKMLEYTKSSHICRRDYLLSLLDAEPPVCFGCDVCDDTLHNEPEVEMIYKSARKNRRLLYPGDFAKMLSGMRSADIIEKEHYKLPGYGDLSHWWYEDIYDGVIEMVRRKRIFIKKGLFWKGLISARK